MPIDESNINDNNEPYLSWINIPCCTRTMNIWKMSLLSISKMETFRRKGAIKRKFITWQQDETASGSYRLWSTTAVTVLLWCGRSRADLELICLVHNLDRVCMPVCKMKHSLFIWNVKTTQQRTGSSYTMSLRHDGIRHYVRLFNNLIGYQTLDEARVRLVRNI